MEKKVTEDNFSNVDMMYNTACFEATQAQQEAIEKEIQLNEPLISEQLDIATLEIDFKDHDVYLHKLVTLKDKYSRIRRLRRDGSCFYRAFGFAYLERILLTKSIKEGEKFKQLCTEAKDFLLSVGYTQFTVEDFYEQFISLIDTVLEGNDLPSLEETFNEQGHSDYYVVFLRLIVSSYLQKNEEFYRNFVDQGLSMKQFCELEVEPMNKESDNIHLMALTEALKVVLVVENCQQSGPLTSLRIPESEEPEDPESPSTIVLLYRPGHYDILYK